MGGGEAIVRTLLKASVVGVHAWRRRGTAGVMDEERGHGRRGAPAWGCGWRRGRWCGTNGDASRGRMGVDVEEEERGAGNGGAWGGRQVCGGLWMGA